MYFTSKIHLLFLILISASSIFAPSIVAGVPANLKLYSDVGPYPDESNLILETNGAVWNFTSYPGSEAPVGVCCDGKWLLYPSVGYRGEATMFGLINPGFCLNTGEKLVESIQLVGNVDDIDTPAITLFPDADYNGATVIVNGDWANIFNSFTSYIVTGYYEDNRNDQVTFYDEFDLQGNFLCILRRSFVRNITQDFGLAADSVRSFQYGCPDPK